MFLVPVEALTILLQIPYSPILALSDITLLIYPAKTKRKAGQQINFPKSIVICIPY